MNEQLFNRMAMYLWGQHQRAAAECADAYRIGKDNSAHTALKSTTLANYVQFVVKHIGDPLL
jgi:hypothetical protein